MPDVTIITTAEDTPVEPVTETIESEGTQWLKLGEELGALRAEVSQLRETNYQAESVMNRLNSLEVENQNLRERLATLETETEVMELEDEEENEGVIEMEVTTETITEDKLPPKRSILKTLLFGQGERER